MNPAVTSVSAFFPCYNDEATIGRMVELAAKTIETRGVDGEIIVINDGSTDGSADVLAATAAVEPRLRVVHHESNRGYGGALLSGFLAANREWVFYTDGDGQFDPTELADLIDAATRDVDVVQGYKLRRADNIARRVIGRIYHRFVSFAFGLEIRDTDCDFRLIRKAMLDRITLVHTTGVICVELVRKLQDAGARFVEVPVHHFPREHGQSQFFRFSRVVSSLRDLVGLWFREVLFRSDRSARNDEHRGAEGHSTAS